jgi:hypothetical protein
LEVNTAVHAACVLALYSFFWWDKPLDVEEPTICSDADIHSLAAYITVCGLYPLMKLSQAGTDPITDLDRPLDSADIVCHPTLKHIMLRRTNEPNGSLVYRGFAFSENVPRKKLLKNWTEAEFRRLDLASQAVKRFGLYDKFEGRTGLSWTSKGHLTARSRNRPTAETILYELWDLEESKHPLTFSTSTKSFALAGLFYGSVHLLVWNRPFRSAMDELLWKISSLTILVSGVPVVIGSFCLDMNREKEWSLGRGKLTFFSKYLLLGISALFTLFYVLCRMFIIAECFLDVFHLPDSAFEVPEWSQYFPHIG